MPLQIIVGAQWGDEGKGRIVDWFAADADIVARFNGGDNAGHSVTVGSQLFKLHLVPSGIIHKKPVAVLGNGMVINPESLLKEIDMLQALGVEITPTRMRISHAAHLITPAHRALDAALEAQRGKDNIGTTGRGIGPAYTAKAHRPNLPVADLPPRIVSICCCCVRRFASTRCPTPRAPWTSFCAPSRSCPTTSRSV